MSRHTINHPIFGPGFECPPPMTFAPRPPTKVDVLDVMQQAARALNSHSKLSDDGDAIVSGYLGHEARNAVANLIECARLGAEAIEAASKTIGGDLGLVLGDRALFLRTALARVQP